MRDGLIWPSARVATSEPVTALQASVVPVNEFAALALMGASSHDPAKAMNRGRLMAPAALHHS